MESHDVSPVNYRRMSVAAKQALRRERMREPAVTCPVCETQTTAADLLEHFESRCPGPREPNPNASWISWRQARSMGVPRETLSRWAKQELVRVRGERQERRYLLRDIAVRMAARRAQQRRQSHKWDCRGNAGAGDHQRQAMIAQSLRAN